MPAETPEDVTNLPSSTQRASFTHWTFGPFGVSAGDPAVFARFLDADRSVAVLFGHRYDLAALLVAVTEVRERVKAEIRQMQAVV